MAATLKQIAEQTGVSIPTVHQILNNYDVRFSEATRKKVLAAASELRYTPNLAARSLVQQRSLLVGVLFYGVNYFVVSDFARGMQSALQSRSYSPIFLTHGGLADELVNTRMVMERHVDGIIINAAVEPDGSTGREELTDLIHTTPTVEVFGQFMHGVPNVRLDYEAAASTAVRSLVEAGHRSIALLVREKFDQPGDRYWSSRDFVNGYRTTLNEAGLESLVHPYTVSADTTRMNAHSRGSYLRASQLLNDSHKPTAAVCYSQESAESLVRWCEQHRSAVPEGFTIAYFGEPMSVPSEAVKLIVLPVPAEHVGKMAIDTLFGLMDGKTPESLRIAPESAWPQMEEQTPRPDRVLVRTEPVVGNLAAKKTSDRKKKD